MGRAPILELIIMVVIFLAPQASANSDLQRKKEGDWFIGAKVLNLAPDVKSVVSIGGEAKIASDTVPEIDVRYFITDNLSLETMFGFTEHKLSAVGTALGDLDLGSTKVLPPTITLQYHFNNGRRFSPYIGIGLNYTFFVDHDPGDALDVSYQNGFGSVLNLGFDYFIGKNNYFNIDIKKYAISTDVVIDAGSAGTADAAVDINPLAVSVGYGWVF
jgi:outer membrane protein